ncbi:lipid-A-disaccharide synthase N-terminal domain-containing protein [Thalassospira alkalitolerans]|uniref:lipid-A-disaccharide synthase N-terminal domain-containing protein n=1 Tax=Thalassospira alkalitolerans TaxID=1293890 RepID=UPI0030EDF1A4|tara:strand:+ start:126536 stop:126880 length:345 start_codon:yes stop_codon:yes gene_type:complete
MMQEWGARLFSNLDTWFVLGIVGQVMFSGRFLVQWLVSEKHTKSIVPVAFWYLSILGGICLMVYGIQRAEPIIILGQSFGLIVYARNLYFIHQEKHDAKVDAIPAIVADPTHNH